MECREAREMIHAACDGELAAADRQQVLEHLAECEGCRMYESVTNCLKLRVQAVGAAADLSSAGAILTRAIAAAPTRTTLLGRFLPNVLGMTTFFRAAAALVVLSAAVFVVIVLVTPAQSMASMVLQKHRLREIGALLLDSNANCCKDLEEWFESRTGHPVDVPEITCKGIVMEGGCHYKHETGNEIYLAAYTLEDKPVTICVCSGPNMDLEKGESLVIGGTNATLNRGKDYTLISWRSGLNVVALVTPFDAERCKEIFASIKSPSE